MQSGALNVAGTYCVLGLFGVVPALMVAADRYSLGKKSKTSFNGIASDIEGRASGRLPSNGELVPGGIWSVGLIGGFAGMFIVTELYKNIGASL